MKTKHLFFISIFILFYFCGKKSDYYSKIAEVVESQLNDSLKNYERIIIIPGSGCTGCISTAENFFIENVKNKKNKFILTYNFSKKNLILKLNKENIERSNVLVDDKNIFYLNDYDEKIYPMVINISGGKIVNVKALDNTLE